VLRPRVLLLAEPLGALGAQLRKNLQAELKTLQTEVGITFIFVTHDQSEALTMSDRIAVMDRGRVEQAASPRPRESRRTRLRRPQVADLDVVLRGHALRDQRAVAGLGVALHAEEDSLAVGG